MRTILPLILLGLISAPSHADLVARYVLGTETVELSYRDAQHVRLDTSRGGYSLISGDRAVAVITQGDRQMVMDVDQMGAVINALRNPGNTPDIPEQQNVSVTDTGQTEQVAGINGRLFVINDGQRDFQVVLTDNAQVVTAGEALAQFFRRFASAMRNEQGQRLLALEKIYRDHDYRGLLRAQGGLSLQSISEEKRPDDFYRAPNSAVSFSMPNFGNMSTR